MIDALIKEGWSYHDSKPEQLALELENNINKVGEEQTTTFLNLSNHTIGDHLSDWKRARKVAEKVAGKTPLSEMSLRAGAFLAVARFMDGDPLGAQQAELLSIGASSDNEEALYSIIDTKMLIAKALIFAKKFKEGDSFYRSVIDSVTQKKHPTAANRSFAITSNNIANELMGISERTKLQSDLMRLCALESFRFWKKCGTWENEERGLFLLTLVENELHEYSEAIAYANQALTIMSENGGEPVDEAFVRLAIAKSYLELSSNAGYAIELQKADNLAASWGDESLFSWYQDERAKVVR